MKDYNSEFSKFKDKIQKSLIKKALGYQYNEVIEEFTVGDDGEKLTKKKVTTKDVPPDLSAVKLLLDSISVEHNDFENMTDEELKTEIQNAVKLLETKISSDEN